MRLKDVKIGMEVKVKGLACGGCRGFGVGAICVVSDTYLDGVILSKDGDWWWYPTRSFDPVTPKPKLSYTAALRMLLNDSYRLCIDKEATIKRIVRLNKNYYRED